MKDIHILVSIELAFICVATTVICISLVYTIFRDCKQRKKRRERIKEARNGRTTVTSERIP